MAEGMNRRAPPAVSPKVMEATLKYNEQFSHDLLIILAGLSAILILYCLVLAIVRYIRTLTCLNNATQRYFKIPQKTFGRLKRHLLSAPLLSRRHNKQLRIGPLDMGILPTRLQSLLLLAILALNVVFTVCGMEWRGEKSTLIMHLRNRSGSLAVYNMIPMVLMAGRNNPLLRLTSISFDSFNLMHRWFGRIIAALSVVHVTAQGINSAFRAESFPHTSKVRFFFSAFPEAPFLMWGFIAFISLCCIIITSCTAFRHAFYETFWHVHVALVSLILAALYRHLVGVPIQDIIKMIISIWVVERLLRLLTIMYRNMAYHGTDAQIEILPGEALRVTIKIARPWTFKPGQHIFLTIPSVGFWTSHPFSVAWSDIMDRSIDPEMGLIIDDSAPTARPRSTISIIMRRRDGFTKTLYRKTERASGRCIFLPALVEGPYGGSHTLHSYGTVMLFAGGVGITHQVPFVRDLIGGYAAGTNAARRVVLIWVIQSPEHLEWIRPWMTTVLAMEKRREILRIQLFVTRPMSTKEIHSPSATVQMFPGRPNVDSLVEVESRCQIGAMGVSVCGPGGLADDVRAACRARQGLRNIDLFEESFGW